MAKKTIAKTPPPPAASRLQADIARRILKLLKDQGAGHGYHLVELDLCQQFGVSRTPVRGALKLLAQQGAVESRANRGFVLVEPVKNVPEVDPLRAQDEEGKRLFIAIAQARNSGRLPSECAQQEIVRQFGVKLPTVIKVLRQMSELGLVERKPGNGWSFRASISSARAHDESNAFRREIEPAGILQPTFQLDRGWLKETRARHMDFRRKQWRSIEAVEFYEMNSEFHEHLARCSGNRYILAAVQQQNQLRRFLNYQWEFGVERVHASIDEHVLILDALDAGRIKDASALMLSHITISSRHTVALDKEPGGADEKSEAA